MGLRICTVVCARLPHFTMAPRAMKAAAMKAAAMKGAALSKSGIASAIAEATKEKPAVVKKLLESLAEVATKEVKKKRQVYGPRSGHDQESSEASDQGGQEAGFRERNHGEGEACQDGCQGLLRCSFEEEHLSLFCWTSGLGGHSTLPFVQAT